MTAKDKDKKDIQSSKVVEKKMWQLRVRTQDEDTVCSTCGARSVANFCAPCRLE